jgi:1,2-diacylglycerol 3-alpha-glucosyltransferase
MRIGILTEFPSPSVQSGPAIHTQLLKQGLEARGHETVLMGPRMPSSDRGPDTTAHEYPSVPWPSHPKVRVAMPGPSMRHLWNAPVVDLIHAQTNTLMSDYANWIRRMWQVPVLNTHTIHMPTHSHFVLSDTLYASATIRDTCRRAAGDAERRFARLYNDGDCLIVQNRHFVDYWRERGVTIPIEVVGRPIDLERFDAPAQRDPFPQTFAQGQRFLVVCRHDREKRLAHLIDLFAAHVLPNAPEATLTLVGNGPEHLKLKERAQASAFRTQFHFPGEIAHSALVDWYRHADVFAYTSLSETFGNVINEALWCGTPVVALDDQMGVSHQLQHTLNGVLVMPDRADTDTQFAKACLDLINQPERRKAMGRAAARRARETSHPDLIISRFEAIYARAQERCRRVLPIPLQDTSRRTQLKAFAFHMSRWAWGHATILGLAYTASHIGLGRPAEPLTSLLTRPLTDARPR